MMSITYQAAMREPLLAVEQERDALRRWQEDGDRGALELLLRSHARQAYAQAQRWTDNPVHLEDLVAEGMIGLMRAADKFDRRLDVRFSTYAAWWVMTCVSSALAQIKTVIDMPARTYLDARMGRLDDEDQARAQAAMGAAVPLHGGQGGDSEGPAADRLACPDMTPEERAAANSSATALSRLTQAALAVLNEQERRIIVERKLQVQPRLVEELAREMAISRERLRQIEARALTKMRKSLMENGFSKSLLE